MARRRLLVGIVGAVVACGLVAVPIVWMATQPHPRFTPADNADLQAGASAERGRLIFAAGDCASCHASPGQPDRLRLGGGLTLASPYGFFHAPNISSHPTDGIGAWSAVDVANALMSGVSPDGTHYYPAFPYLNFARMQVKDIGDLIAYLRTLPAVPGRARQPDLAFPFNLRRFVGLWKLLYFDRRPLVSDPQKDAAWNRGRYLVEGPAHCAECHSSRNSLGAVKPQTRFAGGRDPEGTGFAPNITPARIGAWSEQDIVTLLTTGRTPNGQQVGSSMADVVTNTAMLPASDREAMAIYLKSLPARPTPAP